MSLSYQSLTGLSNVIANSISADIITATNATITKNLSVGGNENITGNVAITGNETITGYSYIYGNQTVLGTELLQGALDVIGTSMFDGAVECNATGTSLTVHNNFLVDGNSTISGNETIGTVGGAGYLTIDGANSSGYGLLLPSSGILIQNFSGLNPNPSTYALNIAGDYAFGSLDAYIGGAVTIQGNSVTNTQGLSVYANTTLGSVGGNLLTVSGNETVSGTLVVSGDVTLNGTGTSLAVKYNETVGGTLTVGSSASIAGLLNVADINVTNYVDVGTYLTVGTTGTFSGTLNANGTGNGLVVTNNSFLGGTLYIVGNTTASTLSTSGLLTANSLSVTNASTLNSLSVTNSTSLNTLSSSGLSTLDSLTVTNASTLNTATCSGLVTLNGLGGSGSIYSLICTNEASFLLGVQIADTLGVGGNVGISGSLSVAATTHLANSLTMTHTTGSATLECSASSNCSLYWPTSNGTAGQVLITDGNTPAQLSFVGPNIIMGNTSATVSTTTFISTGLTVTITPASSGLILLLLTDSYGVASGGSAQLYIASATILPIQTSTTLSNIPVSLSFLDNLVVGSTTTYTVYLQSLNPAYTATFNANTNFCTLIAQELH